MNHFLKCGLMIVLLAGCTTEKKAVEKRDQSRPQKVTLPETNWTEGELSTDDAPEEGEFKVKFETTVGDFTMHVHRDWSPRGAERFYQLIENKYFDGAPFYRVIPGFMVQFGMCGDPKGSKYWRESFPDEEVKQSNMPGFVTYAKAGPDTRSTQLFINYGNNGRLDIQHFAPFAEVVEGMDKVTAINPEYSEQPNQGSLMMSGNKYVFSEFPNIDYIIKATFVDEGSGEASNSEEKTDENVDADSKDESAKEDE